MNKKIIPTILLLLVTILLQTFSLSAQCNIDCDDGCAETIDSLNLETCECEYIIPECDPECLDIEWFDVEECECVIVGAYDIYCEYPEIFDFEYCGCVYCPRTTTFDIDCISSSSYIVTAMINGLPNDIYGIINPLGDTTQVVGDGAGVAIYVDTVLIPIPPTVAHFIIYTDDCTTDHYPSTLACNNTSTCNLLNTGIQRQGALFGVSGFPQGQDLTYTWYNAVNNQQVAQFVNFPYYSPSEIGEYYLIITNPNYPSCIEYLGPRTVETLDGCCELKGDLDGGN